MIEKKLLRSIKKVYGEIVIGEIDEDGYAEIYRPATRSIGLMFKRIRK